MPDKPSAKGGGLIMAVGTALHLELTDRCNFRCVWCGAGDSEKKNISDFDKNIEILEKAKDISIHGIWTNIVQLNGSGEPLLYPRIVEVVREAKERFAFVEFISNGYLLTQEKIDGLLNADINRIYISLTGIIPEVYSRFQGSGIPYKQCEGNLARVINNVINLAQRKRELGKKTYICLKYIKSDDSRSHLKKYVEFWRGTGVDEVFASSLWDFKRKSRGNFKILACNFVPRKYHVCSNGEVFPCCCNFNQKLRHYMGNVYDTPFEDIITSELFLNEKKARMSCDLNIVPKSCISCESRAYRDFFEELKNSRERIFLKSPLKTVIYKLFGPGVILFERITRIKFFYDMYLAYLRISSAKIRKQFLKTKQKE
jgi:MoaA/NifB/PqqE/SkfB family radical SAM enzyme